MTMNDSIMKFTQATQKYFSRGERNNNLPAVARWAKIYEISYEEALGIVRGSWGSDFTSTDENSFKRAWEKAQNDASILPMSEYKKEKENFDLIKFAKDMKQQEKMMQADMDAAGREMKLEAHLRHVAEETDVDEWVKNHIPQQPKDSSFMLKLFSENDLVWMNHECSSTSIENEVKDVKSFAEQHKQLTNMNFYCINPLRDDSSRDDSNVKKFKYMLLEADEMSKREQYLMFIDFIEHGVPVKMVTFTGNKSLHLIIKVKNVHTKQEWDAYVGDIFDALEKVKKGLFDKKCKNPSRISRTPGAVRRDEKTDYEEKKQTLIYLQEDEIQLQNDAREMILSWCGLIYGEEHSSSGVTGDEGEISDDEILGVLKDRNRIADIWNDGDKVHTLMKSPHFDGDGKIIMRYEDKKWANDKSFYSFIQQVLEEQYGCHVSKKDLVNLKIRYKTEEKFPFIGEKMSVRKDIVNTFIPGWLHKALTDDNIPAQLNEPLQKLIDNLFGDDEDTKKWTLQWFREFMHTFSALTSPVFWEIPGCGKSMIAEAFGDAIGDWIDLPLKKDDIQFNAWQEHTVIIAEECSSGSKRDGKDLGDMFKNMITGEEVTIEAKGKDPVKKHIKNCFIFNANISEQISPVFIEDKDRRWTIIRNDDARNLIDIWTREDFDRWDSGEYKMQLMKWIYNIPKDDKVDVRKSHDNKWKQEVIRMSKNNVELAIEEIVETFSGFISNADLIEMIHRDYGIFTTARANGNILKKLGYLSRRQRDYEGKVVRGYLLHGSQDV